MKGPCHNRGNAPPCSTSERGRSKRSWRSAAPNKGRGSRTKAISAVMDVSGGGEVAVLHPSALGAFRHIQLHSSFPFSFSLSFPIWSWRKLGVRWVNMLSGAQIQDLLLLGAPCLHRSMSCIRWRCCWGGRVGVSRESNGRLNSIRGTNAPHSLNAVIQLQAELRWPSCCDFMCLREGGECLLCVAPPHRFPFSYWRNADFIYLSSLEKEFQRFSNKQNNQNKKTKHCLRSWGPFQ